MLNRLRAEPALLGAVLTAAVGFVSAFWVHWSPDQVAAATAVVSVLVGLGVRSQVYPVSHVDVAPDGPVTPSDGAP